MSQFIISNDPAMKKSFDKASREEKNYAVHEANKLIDLILSKKLSPDVYRHIASGLLSAVGSGSRGSSSTKSGDIFDEID